MAPSVIPNLEQKWFKRALNQELNGFKFRPDPLKSKRRNNKRRKNRLFNLSPFCVYCGVELVLSQDFPVPNEATIDHKLPLSKGGSDSMSNIVLACRNCNELKNDMTDEEFILSQRCSNAKFS